MTADPTRRLSELGIILPQPPAAGGSYVPTVMVGDLVFTSGQVAVDGDTGLLAVGKVGADVDVALARTCARHCALNILAHLQEELGELERIKRFVKLTVFVNSAPDFTQQPQVGNGASELLIDIFGEAGSHVRSAVGVAALPRNSPVEIDATVQVRS
jgi:enamine deaminase RidA (YjgF/YER057c/UK114 family)